MAKYRKKPVIIEAVHYGKGLEDGFRCEEYKYSCIDDWGDDCSMCLSRKPYINTLEGDMYIEPTDMIITGVKGERYPCKKDIFDMTYEKVED